MVILKFKEDFDYSSVKPKLCALGEYEGKTFVVIYVGSHPCAYVESKQDLYNCDKLPKDCPAHGGFTFYNDLTHWEHRIENIDTDILKKKYVGWDYGHYGDYSHQYEKYPELISDDGMPIKYTTDDIIDCAVNTIDWMRENGIN